MIPGVTLITPTGMRPESLKNCARYVGRFFTPTVEKLQWIVADDGEKESYTSIQNANLPNHVKLEYIRPKHRWLPGTNTLAKNLLEALSAIEYDSIFFIEDDDWYSSLYLHNMLPLLNPARIVGEIPARYYHVPSKQFAVLPNAAHASLCQTGIDRSVLPLLKSICSSPEMSFIDVRLWRAVSTGLQALRRSRFCIGLKGLAGREGIGVGHRPERNSAIWVPDSDLKVLSCWLDDDAPIYVPKTPPTASYKRL